MSDTYEFSAKQIEELKATYTDIYQLLSEAQVRMTKSVSDIIYMTEKPYTLPIGREGFARASYDNGIVHITVDKVPDKVRLINSQLSKHNEYYKEIKSFWEDSIINAISSLQIEPMREKAYVLIEVFKPCETWDVDNVQIKMIIDGIRYSGKIIKDDTYKDLSYMVIGNTGEKYQTNIYITNFESFISLLKEKCVRT